MGVSTRNTVLAGLATVALFTLGTVASAGGGMGGGSPCAGFGCGGGGDSGGSGHPGPTIPQGPAIVVPGAGGSTGPGCCANMPKGQNIVVPGVNVAGPNISVTAPNVGVKQGTTFVGSTSYVNTGITHSSGESGTVLLSGGGAAYASPGVAPTTLNGLNVTGGEERYVETVMQNVPVREKVCVRNTSASVGQRPVQAVCIDDQGTPHPASQLSGEKAVPASHEGEIYRCMAGTAMQVTVGHLKAGKADFSHAETFACRKGDALVHAPGGKLECKTQVPRRDCNERSLLRRHGPGTKLVHMQGAAQACVPQERTVMKKVSKQVERVRPNEASGPITFDGGVGQGYN